MPDQSHKQTPYDQFNFEIPPRFPEQGVSAAAANAIVNSETWTDANGAKLGAVWDVDEDVS
jgi:glutamate decarboxylase